MPSAANKKAFKHAAIIGAGLAALSLALALHDRKIKVEIHKSRQKNHDVGGAIMLSSDTLRELDLFELFQRTKSKDLQLDQLLVLNERSQNEDLYYFGDETLYGHRGLQVYRHIPMDKLANMVKERHIPIHYGNKYLHFVPEELSSVTMASNNNQQLRADMMIDYDGIHSRVGNYLTSDTVGPLAFHRPNNALHMPTPGYTFPKALQCEGGGFDIAPQDFDSRRCLINTHRPHPPPYFQGRIDLATDKHKLIDSHKGQLERMHGHRHKEGCCVPRECQHRDGVTISQHPQTRDYCRPHHHRRQHHHDDHYHVYDDYDHHHHHRRCGALDPFDSGRKHRRNH